MIWLKIIGKIFRILNAEAMPKQIAGAVTLGMIIGLTPTFSLHNIAVVFLILVIKVNLTAAILSMFAFDLIGYGVDPPLRLAWLCNSHLHRCKAALD